MPVDRPTPNFLYVGMPKAASSWMFEILRQHPEVFVPTAKNIEFFDRNYDQGFDWYTRHFAGANGARAIGELSHDYYSADGACARIHKHLPDAKIICCLREPGAFVVSSFNYARVHTLDRDCDLASYASSDVVDRYLRYTDNLRPFYDAFPADRIEIVFFDEVQASPRAVVRRLYRFLGVGEDFEPDFVDRKVNAARQARSLAMTQTAFAAARLLRGLGLSNLVGAVKRNRLVESLLYRPAEPPADVPADALAAIRDRCRTQYAALEQLIGRPLPPSWYGSR